MRFSEYMNKRAFNEEKAMRKIRDNVGAYDKYRDITARTGGGGDASIVNDHEAQAYAGKALSSIEDMRTWINKDPVERDPYVQQLAQVLSASKYWNQDQGIIGKMREEREARNRARMNMIARIMMM